MARPELGIKRTCSECGAKFYDLNRTPITCAKCGAILELSKPAPVEVVEVEEKEEVEVVEKTAAASKNDPDVISLEEADAEQVPDIEVPDLEDDDGDDEDVFLDDEEDEASLDAIGLDVAVPSEDED